MGKKNHRCEVTDSTLQMGKLKIKVIESIGCDHLGQDCCRLKFLNQRSANPSKLSQREHEIKG